MHNIPNTAAFIGEMSNMRGTYRRWNLRLLRHTSRKHPLREWQLNLQFDPHDIWIGVFWRIREHERLRFLHVYLCLIPTLPLHLTVMWLWRKLPDYLAPVVSMGNPRVNGPTDTRRSG